MMADTMNGTAAVVLDVPVRPVAPRIQRRTKWVAIDPEGYPGFEVELWLNAPAGALAPILSDDADEETRRAAISRIVLGHNGWLDYDGEPYPPTTEPAFWDAVPTETAALVLVALINTVGVDVPNSVRAKLLKSNGG